MFDGIIGTIKEGFTESNARREAERSAQKEVAEHQAQMDAMTGGGLGGSRDCVAHVFAIHHGSSNLDGIFNEFAPHLTNAIYSMYSELYWKAQEATAWKAKCEELEKRCSDLEKYNSNLEKQCTEQSQVIEAFTKDRSKSNSFSR